MKESIHTRTITAGGTLTILLANITSADILKTIALAVTGAIVSFIMSHILKRAMAWWKTRKG